MIQGLLLAAGASRRFGADKLLYPLFDQVPIAIVSARNLRAAELDRVAAVLRPGAGTLRERLIAEGVEVIDCPIAHEGMGASLGWGVRATAEAQGWVVALADMPFIRPVTIWGIAQLLRRGLPLAAPVYQGRRGHPVGFGRAFGADLGALRGDAGARALLQANVAEMALLHCGDAGILTDIDTPGDMPVDQFAD